MDLAFKFLENKLKELDPATAEPEKEASVLIVAPYKPHVARINQLVELEYHNRGFKENLNFIRAGTIHSFQGSEADIPRSIPGMICMKWLYAIRMAPDMV